MKNRKRKVLPSLADMPTLRRIAAASGILVTHRQDREPLFSLRDSGESVSPRAVRRLIRVGALIADDHGLFDLPQSYRPRRPSDGRPDGGPIRDATGETAG